MFYQHVLAGLQNRLMRPFLNGMDSKIRIWNVYIGRFLKKEICLFLPICFYRRKKMAKLCSIPSGIQTHYLFSYFVHFSSVPNKTTKHIIPPPETSYSSLSTLLVSFMELCLNCSVTEALWPLSCHTMSERCCCDVVLTSIQRCSDVVYPLTFSIITYLTYRILHRPHQKNMRAVWPSVQIVRGWKP